MHIERNIMQKLLKIIFFDLLKIIFAIVFLCSIIAGSWWLTLQILAFMIKHPMIMIITICAVIIISIIIIYIKSVIQRMQK